MKFKGKWTKNKMVAYTVATCSAVLLYMILSNLTSIGSALDSFYSFLKPVVGGAIVAYIFNPISKLFENSIFKRIKKDGTRWTLSVAISIIVVIAAIVLLFVALIPQLVDSVTTFASNVDDYVDALQDLLRQFETTGAKGILGVSMGKLADVGDKILDRISDYFSNNMGNFVNTSANIGKSVFDGILAIILAIYFLLDKGRLKSGFTRLMGLIMKDENFKNAGDFFRRCNDIMIRYISFDIIEGIIVGVVCFVFMLVAGMPYSVLISVIIGMTNLAPTFGPLVGGMIACFILVLVKPMYGLAFLIFICVLQAVDGYILKPRLFGESLGVSPLMILVAIILGGRLFGVGGILLAIPFAAIIDFVWRDFVIKKLEEIKAKRYNI